MIFVWWSLGLFGLYALVDFNHSLLHFGLGGGGGMSGLSLCIDILKDVCIYFLTFYSFDTIPLIIVSNDILLKFTHLIFLFLNSSLL
jgi:hypothetical protein